MKKVYLYFALLISILFLSVGNVMASSYQQATATPDFRTPPVTPTPFVPDRVVSDLNFSCPANGATPVGYGSVDPDPAWLATCAACLPTPTNQYDGYSNAPSLGALYLSGGDGMSMGTALDGHQYYFATSYTPSKTRVYLYKEDAGSDPDGFQTMYLTIRFAGYDAVAFGDLDVNDDPNYFHVFYDDELIGTIVFPFDQLPTEYTFTFDLPLEYVSHTLDFVVTDQYGDNVGSPDYMHNWGCTRIYVTEQDESGTFESFTCPLASTVSCSQGSSNPEPTVTPAGGTITLDQEIGSIDCSPYLGGLRCAFDADKNYGGYGSVNATVLYTRDNVSTVYFRVEAVATGVNQYAHFGIDKDGGLIGGGTWSTFTPPYDRVGTGVLSVFETTSTGVNGFANAGFTSQSVARFVGLLYILPQPYVDISTPAPDCVDLGTPVSPYGQTTGNYCQTVVANDPNQRIDFDIVEEGQRVCTQIPYFSLVEFAPDWLIAIINPSFVDFMNSWAYFPASTFCYHSVDFQKVYFLNIEIPIGYLFALSVIVWVLLRITRK